MTVIIDPQNSGISGNMVVGALVDLGLDHEAVADVMEHFGSYFGNIELKIAPVIKSGISSTYVDVKCQDKGHIKYTALMEILKEIKHPEVTEDIKTFAFKVFKTLAEAEAHVHGTKIEDVHFHEVGAADAVADIMGASYAFHKLGLNKKTVYGTLVALGGGMVESKHGKIGIPAPATLEILKNVPVFGGPVDKELTTPTGAALLVNMVDEFVKFYPIMSSRRVGYGAGKMELEFPNVLRIIEGISKLQTDNVSILETNLDNVTGELMGHIFQVLLKFGARDVSLIPTTTKKNRPGHLLRVIAKPVDCDRLSEVIIRETGTLGVRVLPYVHRNIVSRKIITVELPIDGMIFEVRIKVGMIGDDVVSVKPEYEDVKKVSEETEIPLKDVVDRAFQVYGNYSS